MTGILIGVAVCAILIAVIGMYRATLEDIYKEKIATDEVYLLSTQDLWQIRVCRYRKGRTGGQPVLLVHGASVNQHNFTSPRGNSLVDYLVERGFDCWTVDLRGCRSSVAPFERHRNQVTIDDYLNDDIPSVIRFIQQETGYAKVHYCGHSMGGMLLYAYVLKFGREDIASAVTLGSPLGFEGVRLGRPGILIALLCLHPPFAGGFARAMVPIARLLRLNSLLFPMNMHNLAKGLDSSYFYNMLEDPLPGVLKQLGQWVSTPGWRMDGGKLDMLEGLNRLDVPLFAIFGPKDPFVPLDRAQAFFDELPGNDKRLLICSKEQGFKHDYGHCDLAFGAEGHREVFGPIARWFETHSTRERLPVEDADVAAGYQTPLNAGQRLEILSGESYAHLAAAGEAAPQAPAIAPEAKRKSAAKAAAPRKTKAEDRTRAGGPKKATGKRKAPDSPRAATPRGPDLASVKEALTALRAPAQAARLNDVAPISVALPGGRKPAPGKDEPVETPERVRSALSSASGVLETFNRTQDKTGG